MSIEDFNLEPDPNTGNTNSTQSDTSQEPPYVPRGMVDNAIRDFGAKIVIEETLPQNELKQ